MVLPLIPIILIAGTAASLALQGYGETTKPKFVVVTQPKSNSNLKQYYPIMAIIAVIVILWLVLK